MFDKRTGRSLAITGLWCAEAQANQMPAPQQVLDIFNGEWSSAMPAGSSLQTQPGQRQLFENDRVTLAVAQAGGEFDS